jgi:hypothetical protein
MGDVGPADWGDKPLAVVAGGTSLAGFDLNRFRDPRWRVLAVKGSIFDMPWADLGFGLDGPRYIEWAPRLAQVTMPIVWAVAERNTLPVLPNVNFVLRINHQMISKVPTAIAAGGTSGYGALNLAYLKRPRRIVLFGYDYGKSADGKWHHNEQHYGKKRTQSEKAWKAWAECYAHPAKALAEAKIEVFNACPYSGIKVFPRVTIEEGLALLGKP